MAEPNAGKIRFAVDGWLGWPPYSHLGDEAERIAQLLTHALLRIGLREQHCEPWGGVTPLAAQVLPGKLAREFRSAESLVAVVEAQTGGSTEVRLKRADFVRSARAALSGGREVTELLDDLCEPR